MADDPAGLKACRAIGGDQMTNEQYPLADFNRIDVYLNPISAIFQLMVVADALGWQFAPFANRHKFSPKS